VGMPYERIKQLAQMLIFEFNQLAGARGSQVVFTDFNLYWNVPRHLKDAPAIGPGGVETGKPYKDYEKESQLFLKALFEVYMIGDAMGKTFVFPKPLLHINDDFFRTDGWQEFMDLACDVASKQGITYFVFDRGDEVTVSQCCRLKLKLEEIDLAEALTPEKMRFSALQNITINMPRIAYRAHGSDEMLFSELEKTLELVGKAHLQKLKFITSLMELGKEGPVSLLCMEHDGEPYLRLDRLTFLAGLLGLNEMVQYHKGSQLHESPEALRFGLKVVAHMNLVCERLSQNLGINIVLEESPAESSGYRLAKLDMKYFPEQAKQVVKGQLDGDQYYYTNSIHLATDAPIDYVERVQKQSLFHPLIKAGAIIHVWLGEYEPPAASIRKFVEKVFWETNASQVAFSPEFTVCNTCRKTSRGLSEECPKCGSDDTYGITRIVGYYSKVSTWNKGKLGELKERSRTSLAGGDRDVAEGVRQGELSELPRG
jgi:ribonucleoside-triphosphate reductase (formate)